MQASQVSLHDAPYILYNVQVRASRWPLQLRYAAAGKAFLNYRCSVYGAPIVLKVKAAIWEGPVDSKREQNCFADFFVDFCSQPPRDEVEWAEASITYGAPNIDGDTSAGAETSDITLVVAAKNINSLILNA